MAHTPGRWTFGGPIARIGRQRACRGIRKITQAFGAAGGLRPSEGIARLGDGLTTVLPATQLQCRDRGCRHGRQASDEVVCDGRCANAGPRVCREGREHSVRRQPPRVVEWRVMAGGGGGSVATSGTWDKCQPEASRSESWRWAAPSAALNGEGDTPEGRPHQARRAVSANSEPAARR